MSRKELISVFIFEFRLTLNVAKSFFLEGNYEQFKFQVNRLRSYNELASHLLYSYERWLNFYNLIDRFVESLIYN